MFDLRWVRSPGQGRGNGPKEELCTVDVFREAPATSASVEDGEEVDAPENPVGSVRECGA